MTNFLATDYDIPMPAIFARTRITTTAAMISPLTGAIQTAERAGARWQLRLEWVATGAQRDELEAMLGALNGQEHRLLLPMYDRVTGKPNRGAWSGSPVVDGAGQAGYAIDIRGGGLSVTDYAQPGDLLSFDNQIKIVTAAADTDGTGAATIPIWPAIRTAPADATVVDVSSSITGTYYLQEASEAVITDELASGDYLSRLGATFVEDVLQ